MAGLIFATPLAAAGAPVPSGPAVPVVVGTVGQRTTELMLFGLGTVQAWQSITERAQVNGYLATINFREGQSVHKGDLLATIDPRPYAASLAQALARKASDQANLTNDQLNYARDSQLASRGFGTAQQADNDLALVREYTASIEADEASIASAKLELDFCSIKAPVDVGNLIEASAETPIVTIEQIQPIAVVFSLPEQDFEEVETALQQRTLAVAAYSADNKTLLDQGTLVAPSNEIATTTGTISLKAIFSNPHRTLWPGQYVQARLALRSMPRALVVPDGAVQHGPDGLFVFTVAPGNVTHQQPVEVGYDDGKDSTITSGLTAGEQIVTDGQSQLQEGSRISATPPVGSKS